MYSINGLKLDNPLLGWKLMAPTEPLSALQTRQTVTERPGRDGIFPGPSTRGPVTLKFVVRARKSTREDLLALFASPALQVRELAVPGRVAAGELLSSTPEKHYPRADLYEDAFLVRLPEGCYRGATVTTPAEPLSSSITELRLFEGLSAPVQDAIVRLRGPLVDMEVRDSGGSRWWYEGELPAGRYLRFHSDTGRCWITDTDTWSGGTEVSGAINFDGPRDVFEITPVITTADVAPGGGGPAGTLIARDAALTVTSQAPSGDGHIQVRGRPAYLF